MERVYNKLVRDKIPDIIIKQNETPITRILDKNEYKKEIEKKLLEECKKLINADNYFSILDECGDLLEVISTYAALENITEDQIMAARIDKNEKRGAFKEHIFLEKVIEHE